MARVHLTAAPPGEYTLFNACVGYDIRGRTLHGVHLIQRSGARAELYVGSSRCSAVLRDCHCSGVVDP